MRSPLPAPKAVFGFSQTAYQQFRNGRSEEVIGYYFAENEADLALRPYTHSAPDAASFEELKNNATDLVETGTGWHGALCTKGRFVSECNPTAYPELDLWSINDPLDRVTAVINVPKTIDGIHRRTLIGMRHDNRLSGIL